MNSNFIAILPILLFAVIIHEYAHGWVAERCGDDTAKVMGRLTLNPIPHIDLIGTILLPAILILTGSNFWIAWAKPVPINPNKFKNYSLDTIKVALAGSCANFLTAIAFVFVMFVFSKLAGRSAESLLRVLVYGVYINVMLGLFNLIPLPPLDGSKVLYSFLPYKGQEIFRRITPFGFIIIIVLINTYFFRVIFVTIVNIIAQLMLVVI